MGSVLGFIAFGRVARLTALRAKAFGLRLLAYDPFIDETLIRQFGAEPATLDEMLKQSDFVSMHAPATPEAQGLLTEKHFKMMKPTAWFINTGRGPTVDETALITALQQGWIAGASLDVFKIEPPRQDNPLLQMSNVILSPHNASASARFDPARKRRVGQELSLVLTGKWPMSCVNPTVLAGSSLRRWQPYSMERGPNS
jgi:D-3-phosphoglycerate dehydrogenase